MAIFADRVHAGAELAKQLTAFGGTDAVVAGIPRGGVVVAAEVARSLGLPLAAVVVRKLGAAGREETAVGAVADGVRLVSDDLVRALGMSREQLAAVEERERGELARRSQRFAPHGLDARGRTVVVVDDGIATGATATAACRALRAAGAARIVLATPVAPADWRPEPGAVDEFVCAHAPGRFRAVGQFYDRFEQTDDDEVAALLAGDRPD